MACLGRSCLGLPPSDGARSPGFAPPLGAQFLEAVLDRALTPDPVARVVIAERLLNIRAFFELWVRFGLGRCLWREG